MSEKIVTIGDRNFELEVERDGSRFRITAAGTTAPHDIELVATRGKEAEIRTGGRVYTIPYFVNGTEVWFAFDGETYVADVSEKGARTRARHRDHSLSAPMPGLILKILVSTGEVVEKGAPLLILEAMKMEHQINAPYDGIVMAINCLQGELVQPGAELITLDEAEVARSSS
ncbi:MAG TPA: biotin/lipoyl-containing protein [Thermoanaerobaculia bacterium]|nr:biotin/lipoyl-containing protein [Thermoanaerobaculia bacterium]